MRALVFFVMAFLTAPAFANVHEIKEDDDGCTVIAKTAGVIMQARQSGAPLSTMLDLADNGPEDDRKLLRLLVIETYERTGFQSEEYRNRSAMDFRNEIHLMCLRQTED